MLPQPFFVIWRRRREKTMQPQLPAKQQTCTVPPPVPGLPTGSSPYFGLPHAPHWISNPGGVPPPLAGVTVVPTSAEATGQRFGGMPPRGPGATTSTSTGTTYTASLVLKYSKGDSPRVSE